MIKTNLFSMLLIFRRAPWGKMGFNAVATRWVVSTVHVPATLVGKAKIVGKKVARTIVPTTAIAWILRATATRGGRASRATTKVREIGLYYTCWWYSLCNFQYRQHYENTCSDHVDC